MDAVVVPEVVDTGQRGRIWGGVRDEISFRRFRAYEAEGKNC